MPPVIRTVPSGSQGGFGAVGRVRRGAGGVHAGEPGGERPAVAQGELGFAGGEGGGEGGGGRLAGAGVEQDEASGVLRLGGADQAPGCGGGHGRHVLAVAGGDGPAGEDDEAGACGAVVGEPGPQGPQEVCGDGAGVVAGGAGQQYRFGVLGDVVGTGHAGPGGIEAGIAAVVVRGHVPAAGRGCGRCALDGAPGDPVQGAGGGGGGGAAQAVGGDGPGDEGVDGGDGVSLGVGDAQGDTARARGLDPYPQAGGSGRVQAHPAPGERQADPGGAPRLPRGGGELGVQGGVQQRGVQPVTGRVLVLLLGQGDLGVPRPVRAPGGLEALEDGAVLVAGVGEGGVEAVEGDGLGAGRGPGRQVEGGPGGSGGQDRGGVAGPPGVGVVARGGLRARVDGQVAAAGVVGGAEDELELRGVLLREDERGFEGQFLQQVAADLVARAQGEFGEGGAGQQDGAGDLVVGEPGLGAHREQAGEQDPAVVGDADDGAQQRVPGAAESRAGEVARAAGTHAQPVVVALEGVGGQVDAGGGGRGQQALPVHGGAVREESGHGRQQCGGLGPVLAHGGEADPSGGVVGQAGAGERGQGGVGSEFDEPADAVSGEPVDAVGEAHGPAQVAHPVVGRAQFLGGGGPAGQVGDDGDPRRVVGDALGDGPELVEGGVHAGAVEGVGDAQAPGAPLPGAQLCGDLLDGVLVAGDHGGAGAVEGGDAHGAAVGGEQRGDLVLGRLDGDHGAARRERLHDAAAGRDQPAGVGQRPDARGVRGGQFAQGVSDEVLGLDAPGLQKPEQGHFDGEQRGLGEVGAVQGPGALAAVEDDALQGPAQGGVEVGADRVEGRGERGERRVQLTSHADALGSLSREEEGGGTAQDAAGDDVRRVGRVRVLVGEPGQAAQRGGVVLGEDDGAVFEELTGGEEGLGDAGRRGVVLGGDAVEEPGGLAAQGGGAARGDDPRHDRGGGRGVGGRGLRRGLGCGGVGGGLGGRGLQDGVGVGAADTEGGHGGAARPVPGVGPCGGFGEQADVAGRPVDVGRGLADVQGAREAAVAQRHDHLDDAGHAGGGLGVAEVGLQGAEQQRTVGVLGAAVRGQQGLCLDRVAQ